MSKAPLRYLPAQKFSGSAPITGDKLQEYHQAQLLEHTRTKAKADLIGIHHGTLGSDFQFTDIQAMPDGYRFTFTDGDSLHLGIVQGGSVYSVPMTLRLTGIDL